MATIAQKEAKKRELFTKYFPYKLTYWDEYNYPCLANIFYKFKNGAGENTSYNDCIIMADTETSKKKLGIENHIVAWTISIRAFHMNIVSLWGRKPSDMVTCIHRILNNMEGHETFIYFHNLAYDYVFLRRFLFKEFGYPEKALNIKTHAPIYLKWECGLTIKDSLILAQRSLDKWARDLDVEHKKAIGKWDYTKLRGQYEIYSPEELEYIEHDTLAGVECIDKLMSSLNKNIATMPFTATGIPREEVYKRGRENKARDAFKRNHLTFEQYQKALKIYHGGFTHGNRHHINETIKGQIQCLDFASSYPYVMLSEKYPCEPFLELNSADIDMIINNSDTYAFFFEMILIRPRLKSDEIVMPYLQFSKLEKTINPIVDNGRVLCAAYTDGFYNEQDAKIILSQYDYDDIYVLNCEYALKDYLPRWFTDYIFELFRDKTYLKDSPDKVAYALAKAKLNSLYGLCCQRSIRDDITEIYDLGEYEITSAMNEEAYDKYLKNRKSILLYQTGCYVTSYAAVNLFELGNCVASDGIWLYSDTDSCYATKWDWDQVEKYNKKCKAKLTKNGYGPITYKNKEYCLGLATKDSLYTEFRYQGAKRYCGRLAEDGELHITVAGVPKKGASVLTSIEDFRPGLVFPGSVTGKLLHQYNYVEDIYIDADGNETGDSINLESCDYLLDSVYNVDWQKIFEEEIEVGGYYSEE